MADNGDQKKHDGKNGGSKRLAQEVYDRLIQGVDDVLSVGLDETNGVKKSLPEKPASEPPKCGDGGR
jgi:hypothetical protein